MGRKFLRMTGLSRRVVRSRKLRKVKNDLEKSEASMNPDYMVLPESEVSKQKKFSSFLSPSRFGAIALLRWAAKTSQRLRPYSRASHFGKNP